MKYRIVKEYGYYCTGNDAYVAKIKYKFLPFWIDLKASPDIEDAKKEIANHKKSKMKNKLMYDGDGKDLLFIKEL